MLERAAPWLGRGWVRQGRGGGGGPRDTRQPCPAWEGSSEAPQSQWGRRRVTTGPHSLSHKLHGGNMCVNTWVDGWIPLMNEQKIICPQLSGSFIIWNWFS